MHQMQRTQTPPNVHQMQRTQTPLNLFQIRGTRPKYVKYKVHKLHQIVHQIQGT